MASNRSVVAGRTPEAPCAEAGQLQGHHQPDHRDRRGRARAGGVGQHDVALERFQILVADADAGQFSEAGVDPVDRRALGQDALDRGGASAITGAATTTPA